MWNDEITLIHYPEVVDELNNHYDDKDNPIEVTLLTQITSASRIEFYNHGSPENRPEYIALIHECEYEGQHICRFRDEEYSIERTYKNGDYLELTLVRIQGQ